MNRLLWAYSMLLACTTAVSWIVYWLRPRFTTRRPLFVAVDRAHDLTNYIGKIANLHAGAAALGADYPVFNYPAPAAFVYKFFLGGFPDHPYRAFLIFLGFAAAAFAIVLWLAAGGRSRALSGVSAAVLTTAILGFPLWIVADRANIEAVVWAFCAAGVCFALSRRYVPAAILMGIAASIKPFPGLFLLLLVAQRRYKEAALGAGVAASLIILALWGLGPNPIRAYRDLKPGVSQYVYDYIDRPVPPEQLRFNHSLLDGAKFAYLLSEAHSIDPGTVEIRDLQLTLIRGYSRPIYRIVRFYAPVTALVFVALCLVFFRKPLVNQVTAIAVAVALLPLSAAEYTLLYLYLAFGVFLIFLARDVAAGTEPFPAGPAAAFCSIYALLFSPLTFLRVFEGQAKLLLLLVLLVLAARYPMRSRYLQPATL